MNRPNDKWTFQMMVIDQPVSCSHWGLFSQFREVTTPFGYRFANPRNVEAEALRVDGIIEIVPIEQSSTPSHGGHTNWISGL